MEKMSDFAFVPKKTIDISNNNKKRGKIDIA